MRLQNLLLVCLFLMFLACKDAKDKNSVSPSTNEVVEQEQVDRTSIPSELKGIWVLNKLNKKTIKNTSSTKNPTLEIIPSEEKILGNSGCNKYSGTIKLVGKNNIEMVIKETTKIQCDSSHLEERYLNAISKGILSYKITGEKAIFYNDNTTLVFGKTPDSDSFLDKKGKQ